MMQAYGWVFLATGAVFAAAPLPLSSLLGLPNGGHGLWLGLAGSLMAVISLLSFQIAADPFLGSRWDLLLLSKAVASLRCAAGAGGAMALWLVVAGRPAAALAEADRVLKEFPGDGAALWARARAQLLLGKTAEATRELEALGVPARTDFASRAARGLRDALAAPAEAR